MRSLPVTFIEYPRHLPRAHASLFQQNQQVVEQVCRLLGKPLAFERRHDDFDRLLADLLGSISRAAREKLRRVRALRHLPATFVYRPYKPRERPAKVRRFLIRPRQRCKEATPLTRVAGRSRRLDPVKQRVAVAVQTDLYYVLSVAACLSLAPELSAGA